MEKNYAYITLFASNDYLNALALMLSSFQKTNSKYPMYVITTPNIKQENKDFLKNYFEVNIIEEDYIKPKERSSSFRYTERTTVDNYHICMTKLAIFSYTQFDKLVYIDADVIFMQNCDELFDCPHMSAVKDNGYELARYKNSGFFNAGVLVVEPNMKDYNNLIKYMNSKSFKTIKGLDDQAILYKYFKDWPNKPNLHLANGYNCSVNYFHMDCVAAQATLDLLIQNFNNTKILHFNCDKPWVAIVDINAYQYDILFSGKFIWQLIYAQLIDINYLEIFSKTQNIPQDIFPILINNLCKVAVSSESWGNN